MGNVFLQLFNMSLISSVMIIIVMLLRAMLKKAPKSIRLILWSIVALRLIFPFSFESVLSLLPSAAPVGISENGMVPVIDTGINTVDRFADMVIESNPVMVSESVYSFSDMLELTALIWIFGVILMFTYFILSYIRLKKRTAEKIQIEKKVYVCDSAVSPFILGFISPEIILPSILSDRDREYVLLHEKAHIKRLDHIWKPVGFILLSIYWFNPLIWAAYMLLCSDIELSCDEKVIREMKTDDIKGYSTALLNCSVKSRVITACPLAFGENGVKGRIKSVLSYKKPVIGIVIISLAAAVAVAVGFLTNQPEKNKIPADGIRIISAGSEYSGVSIEITDACFNGMSPYITVKWKNETSKECVYGAYYDILRKSEDESFVSTLKNDTWYSIAYLLKSNSEHEKKYYLNNEVMPTEGVYRFESCFNTEEKGIRSEDYRVYIEFSTENAVDKNGTRQFSAKEIVYANGMLSYVPNVEGLHEIRISEYMTLSVKEDEIWKEMGRLEEISLGPDNIDRRMHSDNEGRLTAMKIRSENKRAWQLHVSRNSYGDSRELFVLLLQNDGSLIFGRGEYNIGGMVYPNSDSSYLSWLCTLNEEAVRMYDTPDTSSDGISVEVYEKITSYAGLCSDMERFFSIAENEQMKYMTDRFYLPVIKIETGGEYAAFVETADDELTLTDGTDEFPSFFNSTRDCTTKFFENNVLLVVYAPTSFAWFENVSIADGEFRIVLTEYGADKKKYPEKGYFGIIKISREALNNIESYNAVFDTVGNIV